MKKLLFILTLFISFVAAAQPGPVNAYKTRQRYWLLMTDSLNGLPTDTFNLRSTWAINNGWNNYAWIATKGDSSYMWSIAQQKWILTTSKNQLPSKITIISDSSIQICNGNNVCDTFISNLSPPVVTNVTTINDSTLLICINGSCDTIITHITVNPPITSTTILNDSTLIICNVNGCDTFVIHSTVNPPITTTTILNDSTIIVCNTNGCDTFVVNTINPPITTVTVLNDTTIIVCNNVTCDTLVIHPPINSTTILNDSTIIVCNNFGCDTLVIHPPIINSTVLNDSTIVICGTNSCDTIVLHSSITNVTIINDTTVQVCGSNILGPEQITNGGFIGNANGWQLGSLWAYGTNNIIHNFGSAQPTAQAGTLIEGGTYTVSANIGGSTGTIDLKLDAGTTHTYSAGNGVVTFTGTWNNANNYAIVLTPSTDFDGTITNVSVRQVLPNCDTLQVPPTIFIPSDTFYVKAPLYSTGVGVTDHDTVLISKSGRFDSGYLSMEDWQDFNHKVDSLYYHPSILGQDSFLYDNGDATGILWYVNDVNANGLISGGQVLPSGTPYVFNVTSAVYRINGIRYTSPATQITIPTADPSLPRTDRFVVDTSGNAALIPGIAANPNLAPSFDVAWQLSLTTVDLPAANPPTITDSLIYNENVLPEWIPVTNNGTTTNPASTAFPWLGTFSVDVTNINQGDVIIFTHTGTFNLTPFVVANGSLTGFILLKQPIPASAHLAAQFFNGGTNVSPLVTIPLVANNIATYQGFSIPLSAFALTNNSVTVLRIQYVATNNTNNLGFHLDDINLQSGIQPPVSQSNALILVSRRPGTDSVMGTYQNGAVSYQFKDSSGLAGFTADNGLTKSTATNVQLGGTLIKNTTIDANAFVLTIGTATAAVSPLVVNSTTGTTITAVASAGGVGVLSQTTSGIALNGQSSSSYGLVATTTSGTAAGRFVATPTATGTVTTILQLARQEGAASSNGTGESIDFSVQTFSPFNNRLSNQIISKWTDATDATRTSQFILTGVNSAVTADLFTLNGNGQTRLNKYGVGSFTSGTGTYLIATKADGTLMEYPAGGIVGGGIQTLQQTFNTEVGGSVLTKGDSIQAGSHFLFVNGSNGGDNGLLMVQNNNASAVSAIYASSDNGIGVYGNSTNQAGVVGISSTNNAITGISFATGAAFNGISHDFATLQTEEASSSTNTVLPIANLLRTTSGTAANGIGSSIDLYLSTTTVALISNQIVSKWTDATSATRTSQFDITGVNSAATQTIMSAYGTGVVGIGISTGYTATRLEIQDNGMAVAARMVKLHSTSTGVGLLMDLSAVGSMGGLSSTTVDASSISGTSTNGTGVVGTSTAGTGVSGSSTNGTGGVFVVSPSSTSTVVSVALMQRSTTGTAANGIGGALDFSVSTTVAGQVSNRIISKWTDATDATRTSQFGITGVKTGVTQTLVTIDGDGAATFLGPSSPSITVTAINTTGVGIFASTTSGVGVESGTTTGIPAYFTANPSTTNDVVNVLLLERDVTGTAANGLGGDVRFSLETSNGSGLIANKIISKWTDATTATATSQLIFTGLNSGATGNILVISGDGSTQMPKYGAGAATFDASGNITSVSDVRLKDVQGYYNGGLNELMNVNPIIYKWNEKSGMEMKHDYIGFSAQNIQSALGENAIGVNREGYLSIQDRAILATLVNAIKEQQKEIEHLRSLIQNK
jgi:hypothetical protein